jgi:hypothetical protein
MKIFATLLFAMFVAGAAHAATVDEDVNRYVQIFDGSASVPTEAVESLAWMGLSDPRLFDVIERRVLQDAEAARNDRRKKNEIGLFIRGLGFSGNPKYLPTIRAYLQDVGYARDAKKAMADMQDYEQWNPVISRRAGFDPQYSDEVNRILNMLRADDFMLKRIGAKRVYFRNKEDVLLNVLEQQVRSNYTRNDSDDEVIDVIAWQVKALGSAKQEKYRPLLQEVAAQAKNSKIAKYASKGLER